MIYSDGVTEAMNSTEEEFDLKRLKDIIQTNKENSAEEIMQIVLKEIEIHVAGEEQMDDITIIVMKRTQ